ncbi:hypothetical protein CANTEDRAFT_115648 [Yamadazyma tenuis ATCC 10573]|uniref:Uncharacterized protein n=3 Tax=Candida tenuis TaxID=2315449 RepID=G3BBF3_CANTC|nr:uncharacterized protein CANTEDRAFT_115648 [Yamadazyma tenuis ATCC 10573]EGV62177.1 hypothetical protein CANTEDRAFT_115648 [Yamadazyma tenuis ATCC 10573]
MVFETDEEDEDNEHRGSHDRFELDTTFIMPKVSMDTPLSNTCRQMTITLLSSCDLSCHNETNQLMSSVQRELGGNVNIVHLSLEKQSLRDRSNDQIIKDSNLIFIVNDGSFVFIDFLNNIFNGLEGPKDISESDYEDDSLPKLTVINMMTVNYFINLFDLINNLKPYQIWKTSSLSQQNLLNKFKDFIEYEMDNSLYCTTLSKETRSKFESSFVKERSNSVYSSLITVKRPNYKKLEKQFKAELSVDSSQVNPLNLDLKRLSCFNAICLVFGRLMNHSEKFSISTPSSSKIPNLYLIGSFTVGVSLGLGIASGLARVVGLYLSDGINTIADSIEPKTLVKEIKVDNSILSKLSNSVFENEDVFDGLVKYLSNLLSGLQSTSSFMVDAAKGGFQKLMAVVF